MNTERIYEIRDIDGSNIRHVTLAQFRADIDARKAMAKPISDAWRRVDMKAVDAAQVAFRRRFPENRE